MKTIVSSFALVLLLGSCTPSMNFLASSVVPAATGKAQVKRDKNRNYVVRVNVRNLAPPTG